MPRILMTIELNTTHPQAPSKLVMQLSDGNPKTTASPEGGVQIKLALQDGNGKVEPGTILDASTAVAILLMSGSTQVPLPKVIQDALDKQKKK